MSRVKNELMAPSTEKIAQRAYELFLAREGRQGSPEQDWYEAERELRLGSQLQERPAAPSPEQPEQKKSEPRSAAKAEPLKPKRTLSVRP